jgi:hypothetical protein
MLDTFKTEGGNNVQTVSMEGRTGVRRHRPGKPFWSFFGYLNVLAVFRRRKAESRLLESFKSCYPRWQKEGFIKKPR